MQQCCASFSNRKHYKWKTPVTVWSTLRRPRIKLIFTRRFSRRRHLSTIDSPVNHNCSLAIRAFTYLFEFFRTDSSFDASSSTSSTVKRFYRRVRWTEEITISRGRHNVLHGSVMGFIRSFLKHREILLHPAPLLTDALLSQLQDSLAATPVLFELTSFCRYERESVRLHRPSNFVQVAPIWISIRSCLHWRIGTPVRVSFGGKFDKVRGPDFLRGTRERQTKKRRIVSRWKWVRNAQKEREDSKGRERIKCRNVTGVAAAAASVTVIAVRIRVAQHAVHLALPSLVLRQVAFQS